MNGIRKDLTDISNFHLDNERESRIPDYIRQKILRKLNENEAQNMTIRQLILEACKKVFSQELNYCYQTRSFPELEYQSSNLLAGANASLLVANGMCALTNFHPLISLGLVGGMIATYAYSYSNVSSIISQEKPDLEHVFQALKWCMRAVNDQLQLSHDASLKILTVVERCIVSIPLNLSFKEGSLQKATANVDEPKKVIEDLIEIYQDIIAETKKYKDKIKFSLLLWID